MGTVRMLRSIYHSVVPSAVRESRLVLRTRRFIQEKLLWHDAIYSSDYYANTVEWPAERSADVIAESILLSFRANSLVDVGCGTGAVLYALQRRGCRVLGLEYSQAALRYCHLRKIDVRRFDLERDTYMGDRNFDVAISMEVAEHLPEKTAGRYVKLLTELSDVIVFTAARPNQGGRGHVNEQPPSYWIAKFQFSGFAYDDRMSRDLRESWRSSDSLASWYWQNLMIFRRTCTI